MGRQLRTAAGITVVAMIAGAILLAPSVREAQQQRDARERREKAEKRESVIRALQLEQRPRFRRSNSRPVAGTGPNAELAARAAVLDEVAASILGDARARVRDGALDGPIRRVECEPFPRSVTRAGAEDDLSRRRGRYYCIAVTAEFEGTAESIGGALGHPYRAQVDFMSGRYAFCKVSGRPDPTPDPRVTTPRVCGGR